MQFLEEKSSPDGSVVAKIFDDGDGGYLIEKWIDGVQHGAIPTNPGADLNEVRLFASQWVGQVGQLNG